MKKSQSNRDTPAHFAKSTDAAKRRWASLSWASSLKFFEDEFCLWPCASAPSSSGSPHVESCRILSPEEAEKLLGFPKSYTALQSSDWKTPGVTGTDEHGCLRRNAVGNGIAVPVFHRLVLGTLVSATIGPLAPWSALTRPPWEGLTELAGKRRWEDRWAPS